MNIDLPVGKYIVAVSGGVDSVVLLDMLASRAQVYNTPGIETVLHNLPGYQLTVAHFDHGIRTDSVEDRLFVQRLAEKYQMPYVYQRAELGSGTSEATARKARYEFLHKARQAARATAIVTAHHQDDVVETIIINWLRGTKSRGLSSLRSTSEIKRPLLGMTKKQIESYARLHALSWREDSTNDDESYTRNYVRKHYIPRLSEAERRQLLGHGTRAAQLNDAIDELADAYLAGQKGLTTLSRPQFAQLPLPVAYEILAAWIRRTTSVPLSTKLLQRLTTAIVSARNGTQFDVARGYTLHVRRDVVELSFPQK